MTKKIRTLKVERTQLDGELKSYRLAMTFEEDFSKAYDGRGNAETKHDLAKDNVQRIEEEPKSAKRLQGLQVKTTLKPKRCAIRPGGLENPT